MPASRIALPHFWVSLALANRALRSLAPLADAGDIGQHLDGARNSLHCHNQVLYSGECAAVHDVPAPQFGLSVWIAAQARLDRLSGGGTKWP
jgi:hypothetical protein